MATDAYGLAPIFATTSVACLLVWAMVGVGGPGLGAVGHLVRRRRSAALLGLVPCLLLTLPAVTGGHPAPAFLSALLAAAAFLAHGALDPARQGFWHHRRLRPVAVVATFALATALGAYLPYPELIPALFAAGVFHRLQRQSGELMRRSVEDVEGLSRKLMTFEAKRQAEASHLKNADDRLPKAG